MVEQQDKQQLYKPGEAEARLAGVFGGYDEEPWFASLVRQVKERFNPPPQQELVLTSKPIPVKDIWGAYGGNENRAGVGSILIHAAVVLLLIVIGTSPAVQKKAKDVTSLIAPDLAPYMASKPSPKQMGGGGGGGDRSLTQASKGKLPRFADKQFTPPMAVVNNPAPKLVMEPTLIIQPDAAVPNVAMPNYGDPLAKLGAASNGTGSGSGIGSGSGGGVGSGRGAGMGPGEGGGFGGGVYRIGGGVSAPSLIYKVEPEYSEEARKAKHQGTVVLDVVVDDKGMPQNVRVIRAIGLGLDEKAIEAVSKWRFKPGLKDGRPVAVRASIEVNFRLL